MLESDTHKASWSPIVVDAAVYSLVVENSVAPASTETSQPESDSTFPPAPQGEGTIIADTNVFVTYIRDEEPERVADSGFSSKNYHVTARSVNYPGDALKTFSKDVSSRDKNSVTEDHLVPVAENRNNSSVAERQHPGSENENCHTVIRTFSNQAVTDGEMPLSRSEYSSTKHHRPNGVYTNGQRAFENFRLAETQQGFKEPVQSDERARHVQSFNSENNGHGRKPESGSRPFQDKRLEQKGHRTYMINHSQSMDSSSRDYSSTEPRHFSPDMTDNVRHHQMKDEQVDEYYTTRDLDRFSDDEEVVVFVYNSEEDAYIQEQPKMNRYTKSKPENKLGGEYIMRDYKQTRPIYVRQSYRREPAIETYYDRSTYIKPRYLRPVKVVTSSYSDDFDEENDEDSAEKTLHKSTRKNRRRQRKPVEKNQDYLPSTNVSSFNEVGTPFYHGGVIPSAPFSNFLLYTNPVLNPSLTNPVLASNLPTPVLAPSIPTPYVGFPYSLTTSPMDQQMKNSNINMIAMKNYLDAMSASLASIPQPTNSTSPYTFQQLPELPKTATPDIAETQNSFKSANQSSEPAIMPASQSQAQSEMVMEKGAIPPSEENSPSASQGTGLSSVTNQSSEDQKSAFEDWRDRDQKQQNGPEVYLKPETEFKVGKSGVKENSSATYIFDISDILNIAPPTKDVGHDKREATPRESEPKQSKHEVASRQFSSEADSEHLPSSKSIKKKLKTAASQTDPDRSQSSQHTPALPEAPLFKSDLEFTKSTAQNFRQERSTSTEIQSRGFTSPPPPILPKPKTLPEKFANQGPRSPSYHLDTPSNHFSQRPAERDLFKNEQSMSSNIFPISNLTVIESPGHVDTDTSLGIKKNIVKARIEEYSARASETEEKFMITHMYTRPLTSHPNSVHPEADYDVYPPKSITTNDQSNRQTGKKYSSGDNQFSAFPEGFNRQEANDFYQTKTIKAEVYNPNYSVSSQPRFDAYQAPSPKKPPSPVEPPLRSWNLINTPPRSQAQEYPELPTYVGDASRSFPHLIKSTGETYGSLQPNSQPAILSPAAPFTTEPGVYSSITKQQRQQEPGTDIKDIPYQFYNGDSPLFSVQSSNAVPVTSVPEKSSPSKKTKSNKKKPDKKKPDKKSDSKKSKEPEKDISNDSYILYKGPNYMSVAPGKSTFPVTDQTKQIPLTRNPEPDLKDSKFQAANPESYKTPNELVLPGDVKRDVPIPPRDFDSDTDKAEYIYTANGWAHILDNPRTSEVMFCTSVEDRSAEYLDQLYQQRSIKKDVNESILDRFFKECLPNYDYISSQNNTAVNQSMPFWRKISTSTLSLNWDSEMKLAENPYVTTNISAERLPQNYRSLDKDSGVSSASLTTKASEELLDVCGSGNRSTPGEDYSSSTSCYSSSSMELGGDYLSCNESAHKRH